MNVADSGENMFNSCLLSICIPSYKRVEITRKTIQSILAQVKGDNRDKLEVVLVDNDPERELSVLKTEFGDSIKYIESDAVGFMNSVFAMNSCSGKVVKLHNSTMRFDDNALKSLMDIADWVNSCHGMAMLTNGKCRLGKNIKYDNINDLIVSIGVGLTWSNSILIRSETLRGINRNVYDKIFPQVDILLDANQMSDYIHCDIKMFSIQFVQGKGGYNVFEAFTVNLFEMLERHKSAGHINHAAIASIRKGLMYSFFPIAIFKNVLSSIEKFGTKNAVGYLRKYYSIKEIVLMFILALFYPIHKIFNLSFNFFIKNNNNNRMCVNDKLRR